MKKKILFLISCLIVFVFVLSGCGGTTLEGGPQKSDAVYGNGGLAVVKGEYLYFVNSYTSYSGLVVGDNKYGSETKSAIYRTKLNAQGLVEFNEDGVPQGAELLAPQIAGFEYGGIYIFGEYLYYATPYSSQDSSGEPITGILKFERVKLNGADHKNLYTSESFTNEGTYTMLEVENKVHIMVYEGTILTQIIVDGARVTEKTLTEKATSVAIPTQTDIDADHTPAEFNRYIYYTREAEKATDKINSGYVVEKIKLNGNGTPVVLYKGDKHYKVDSVANSRLFFYDEGTSILYSTAELKFNSTDMVQYSHSDPTYIKDYWVVEDPNKTQTQDENNFVYDQKEDKGIVVLFNSNKIVYYRSLGNYQILVDGEANEENYTIMYLNGNYVYYSVEGGTTLFRKNIYDTTPAEQLVENFNLNVSEDESAKDYFDYDGNYFFFFNKVEDTNQVNYYLFMFKLENGYTDDTTAPIAKYIGVLDKADTEEQESESSDAE